MIKISFNDKFRENIVIALGFFDCVHAGHAKVISRALEIAAEKKALCGVFTFSNNPAEFLGRNKDSEVMTFNERADIIEEMGVDVVISAVFDDRFKNLSKEDFISALKNNFKVSALVAGEDYTFGRNAEGGLQTLKDAGFELHICPFLTDDGKKISTSAIKTALSEGNIPLVNKFLGRRYAIISEVIKEREIGRTIGFPTANFRITDKRLPGDAVYDTTAEIDGIRYKSITNIGSRPTFNEAKTSVETYVLGFAGNLYGKKIKVEFLRKIREITAFSSVEELRNRLEKDKLNREVQPL